MRIERVWNICRLLELQKKTQKGELRNPLHPKLDEQTDAAPRLRSLQIAELLEKPRENRGGVEQRIKQQLVQNGSRGARERFGAAELPGNRLRGIVETWKRSGSTAATATSGCG